MSRDWKYNHATHLEEESRNTVSSMKVFSGFNHGRPRNSAEERGPYMVSQHTSMEGWGTEWQYQELRLY